MVEKGGQSPEGEKKNSNYTIHTEVRLEISDGKFLLFPEGSVVTVLLPKDDQIESNIFFDYLPKLARISLVSLPKNYRKLSNDEELAEVGYYSGILLSSWESLRKKSL